MKAKLGSARGKYCGCLSLWTRKAFDTRGVLHFGGVLCKTTQATIRRPGRKLNPLDKPAITTTIPARVPCSARAVCLVLH